MQTATSRSVSARPSGAPRGVLDQASAVYLCSEAHGAVVDCNRAAEEVFGADRDALLGMPLTDLLVLPQTPGESADLRSRLGPGGRLAQPLTVTVGSGQGATHLEVSAWSTEGDGGPLLHALCHDVTAWVQREEALTTHGRRHEEAQRLAGMGSWEWDLATDSVVWSRGLYRVLGIDESFQPTTESLTELLHTEDRSWVREQIGAAATSGQPVTYEARIIRADGMVRWIAAHGEVATDETNPVLVTGVVYDITSRKDAELELAGLATRDPLTGLSNRTLFADRLEHCLAASGRTGEPVALLLLDLDAFKPVNDTHGHLAGDTVLVQIAARLQGCTRPGDTLARLGGDEFALVLPGADTAAAAATAHRIREAASGPVEISGAGSFGVGTVTVGASVGVAVSTAPPRSAGELRREADLALYTAKRGGRDRHVIFTPALLDAATGTVLVNARDAHAWAHYMRALRADIAERKEAGALPALTRAPESALRTLQVLLAAIEHLPTDEADAVLALPESNALAEFVFHQSMVHSWADSLVRRRIIATRRPVGANRFWRGLQDAVS